MSIPDKYKLAREFRAGAVQCCKCGAIDPEQSEAFTDGYNWAYQYLRTMLNEEVNKYVVQKGYKPFSNLEAMRK